jgi:DNA-binding MarR family transcriptional regulator
MPAPADGPHWIQMDSQDIRTLQLLEEMEKEKPATQRDLARKLNVSLGLVNSFIKRLANKGYFKISTIPKNRVRYILTPKGVAEKSRLTYEYIQYSYLFYRNARKELNDLFARLESQRVQRIVFLGAGDLAEIAYISLQNSPIRLVGIVDEKRKGERFLGFEIKSPADLNAMAFDRILVTHIGLNEPMLREIAKQARSHNDLILLRGWAGIPTG